MKHTLKRTTAIKLALIAIFSISLFPSSAYAASSIYEALTLQYTYENPRDDTNSDKEKDNAHFNHLRSTLEQGSSHKAVSKKAEKTKRAKANKILSVNEELINEIGTQESTGHTICCAPFSCAYADAIIDGQVHDHSDYSCSYCMWPNWGGGDSSYRYAGEECELLFEADEQISQGKPVVTHVSASYGEHWIPLIGFKDAYDPNSLTISNFITIDPWDGQQIIASERFELYGDGCQHISER